MPGAKVKLGVETPGEVPDLSADHGNLMPLTEREYCLMRDLVYHRFGIHLGEHKRALIAGRLQKVVREQGFDNFSEYHDYLNRDATGEALTTLIDRISTNHTYFYREKDHFEFFFRTVLPELAARERQSGRRTLHLWCPGCSSGEEPYTLAMLILEHFRREMTGWDLGLLATDISSRVLRKAQAGIYPAESVARLPRELARAYFDRAPDGRGRVQDRVRQLVLFRRLNLMRPDYPFRGKFSVIFCRNVMIYFDPPTRQALTDRFHRVLEPEGYLFIGHSETLGRNDSRFRYVRPAVYQRVGS
ncbi:MAG: protein-glutamate O-methyltransferase CheR [Candidatus Zixiibacteriota bacterium]|nr:MAG: protein-glutamate O-methyltransferase CheR [candidate division Zixibacteria bacterium]